MNRRSLITYSAAGSGVLAFALFVGWWQVDGQVALEPAAQRPLPLQQREFQMIAQNGSAL
jgi:protein SCO1/2